MTPNRLRRLACVTGLATAATLATAGGASAATTVTTGILKNEFGVPTSGTVHVYAPLPQGGVSPRLGTAQATPDGRFTVTADDPAQLVALAKRRNGWLDWLAVADTGGREGMWSSTSFIATTGGSVRSVRPDAVAPPGAGKARVASVAPAPRIAITAKRPQPARIAQSGECKNKHEEQRPQSVRKLAVVGELNNAYNDGTRARFVYGQGGESATWFGFAVSQDSGHSFFISGENYAAYEGRTGFPTVGRRYARKMRSGFEFTRYAARNNTCAVWDVYIRVTDWVANQDTRRKQRGTLNRCLPEAFGRRGYGPGGSFSTSRTTAVRWERGATAFGAGITTRSGFDERVRIGYQFGGKRDKQHYLCGPDGRQSPARAGRIFSGAVRR